MSADGLEFLYQVNVNSRNYINIPSEVYNFFSQSYSSEIKYAWHFDNELESLLVAGIETSEDKSGWIQTTTHESPNGRTRVPAEAASMYNIREGDNLYLLTHDLMSQTERPSVIVWDLDRIEKELFDNIDGGNDLLSRRPSF